jgi:hypothetical protein
MNLTALRQTLELGEEVKNSVARISFFLISKSAAIVIRFSLLDTTRPRHRRGE